jgi:hypothetical protein
VLDLGQGLGAVEWLLAHGVLNRVLREMQVRGYYHTSHSRALERSKMSAASSRRIRIAVSWSVKAMN